MRQPRSPKSKRAAIAAARTYLKDKLGWLRGFPIKQCDNGELEWQTLPRAGSRSRPQVLRVTRERLRRTEYGRNTVRRRFPRAIGEVVGDVDAWTVRTNAQLAVLKASIHAGADLPSLPALVEHYAPRRATRRKIMALAEQEPGLAPLTVALVWMHWLDEEALALGIENLASFRQPVTAVLGHLGPDDGRRIALQCLQLVDDKRGAALLDLLADERCWSVPLTHGDFYNQLVNGLKRRRTGGGHGSSLETRGAVRPEARLGADLCRFIADLCTADGNLRERYCILIELLVSTRLLQAWQAWWRHAGGLERETRQLIGTLPERLNGDQADRCRALETRIRHDDRPPSAFRWSDVSALVEAVARSASAAEFEALVECAQSLSGHHRGRPMARRLLEGWCGTLQGTSDGRGAIVPLLKAQRDLVRALPDITSRQEAWVADDLSFDLIDTWIDEKYPQRLIEPCLQALQHVALKRSEWSRHNGPFRDYSGWANLLATVERVSDAGLAAELLVAVPPDVSELPEQAWTGLLALADARVDHFAVLAGKWRSKHWSDALCKELHRLSGVEGVRDLLAHALMRGENKRASRLVALAQVNREFGFPVDAPERVPPAAAIDLAAYPAEFHALLRDLAAWDDKAGAAAEQILSKDFPVRQQLEMERAKLRAIMDDAEPDRRGSLEARLQSIERRLHTPPVVSAQRRANLRYKLEQRLLHARLQAWSDRLETQLRDGLRARVGSSVPDELIERDEVVRVLTALPALAPSVANLAFRLVEARCGEPPWDLRSDPANVAFLDALTRKGASLTPWLDGIGARQVRCDNIVLTLDLECDPLEVMRMGEPFETCLAPGSFNFFSAVSNAADINKRVIYAKDNGGTIQARCLVALTDGGDVIPFTVYAHANRDIIVEAVKCYVETLAARIGGDVVTRGEVRNLVAHDWYDDGAVDLTGHLRFLDFGSPFYQVLQTVAPEQLVAAIEKATGGRAIVPSVVCAMARTDAVRRRPELIVPLLPFLGDVSLLDRWSRLELAPIVRRSGHGDLAFKLIKPLISTVSDRNYEYSWVQVEVARELNELGLPQRALRLIVQSRARTVRSWQDEWTPRTMVAADALRALRRPYQAIELYRIALDAGVNEAKRPLSALTRELGLTTG